MIAVRTGILLACTVGLAASSGCAARGLHAEPSLCDQAAEQVLIALEGSNERQRAAFQALASGAEGAHEAGQARAMVDQLVAATGALSARADALMMRVIAKSTLHGHPLDADDVASLQECRAAHLPLLEPEAAVLLKVGVDRMIAHCIE